MSGNFDDAMRKHQDAEQNRLRLAHPALVCPLCGEKRLEKMRPHGDGRVWCLTCADEFEVKP